MLTLRGLFEFRVRRRAGAARRGRARGRDRQALRHRRDEPGLDLDRGAHDARRRDEPHRRQVEHRRGRRGRAPLPAGEARARRCKSRIDGVVVDIPLQRGRLAALEDQAGGVGPLRRHRRVPRQRRPAPDQDGAGREARRGRPAARPQGLRVHRASCASRCPGVGPHLAAAAPRHLLDRGPGAADPRPEEREPAGVDLGEARLRGRRRHGRRRRGQGQGRPRDDRRPRRRHRRVAAVVDQARRHAVGARARRDAADAGAEPAARPHRRAGRRPDEDRPRRRHRRAARRRRVRLRDGAAGRRGLHHDAQVPPQHLPGRHRDAGSGAAPEVHRRSPSTSSTTSSSSPRKCAS